MGSDGMAVQLFLVVCLRFARLRSARLSAEKCPVRRVGLNAPLGGFVMIVQCSQCKRIRVDGVFRLPWPGEMDGEISEVYCARCAREMLERIQSGEFVAVAAGEKRRAVNS